MIIWKWGEKKLQLSSKEIETFETVFRLVDCAQNQISSESHDCIDSKYQIFKFQLFSVFQLYCAYSTNLQSTLSFVHEKNLKKSYYYGNSKPFIILANTHRLVIA